MTKIPGVYQRCRADCPPRCRKHRWAFAIELATIDGKRQRVHRSGFATQRDAIEARDAIRDAYRRRRPQTGAGFTVADAIDVWWARGVTARGEPWRASTRLAYRTSVDRYVLPELGPVQLAELRAADIEVAYAKARRELEVSGATISRAHACLRAAVRLALRDGRITRDPTQHVAVSMTRPKVHPWTLDEWHAFAAATAQDRLAPLYRLAADSGMRRGELVGLQWQDVDLTQGIVTVRRARVQAGRTVVEVKPKTRSGEDRRIFLTAQTCDSLRNWQIRQLTEQVARGSRYEAAGYVFTRPDGSAWVPELVTSAFQRAVRRSKVRKARFHDLRHLSASIGYAAGESPLTISRRLGHASVAFTLNTYGHLWDEQAAEGAALRGRLLG